MKNIKVCKRTIIKTTVEFDGSVIQGNFPGGTLSTYAYGGSVQEIQATQKYHFSFIATQKYRLISGTPERGTRWGKRSSRPFLKGVRGQECLFKGTIHLFKNIEFDSMKTMNLTFKSNNHRSLNWSYPNMQKRTSFTSVRIFLIVI